MNQPIPYANRLGLALVPWEAGGLLLLYGLQYLCLVGGCTLLVLGLVLWQPLVLFGGLLALRFYLFFGMAGEALMERLQGAD